MCLYPPKSKSHVYIPQFCVCVFCMCAIGVNAILPCVVCLFWLLVVCVWVEGRGGNFGSFLWFLLVVSVVKIGRGRAAGTFVYN
ncbi:hypothetical protein GGS20DRAFT_549019 [Poronia punctata]|nr:hypothetical protein GGS20DRAFT_549019 [Poronia punctata]